MAETDVIWLLSLLWLASELLPHVLHACLSFEAVLTASLAFVTAAFLR